MNNPRFNIVLAFLLINVIVEGLVLSKSKVTMCENQDKNPYNVVEGKACEKKLLVTMSVVSGQQHTEMVYANVSKIYDETSNEGARLYNPFTLSLAKSAVTLVYPYTYTGQNVNNKPTEKVKLLGKWHNPDPRTMCGDKWDEDDDDDASCGYKTKNKIIPFTDKTNEKDRIWDSQGFCCHCSKRDKWRSSFGSKTAYTRGGIKCGLLKSKQASAHCLEFDDLWYTVHEIGFWQMEFTVTIKLHEQVTKVVNNKTKVELVNGGEITLGPNKRSGTGLYNRVVAHFIGEFRNTKQFPTLSERYLLIPEVTRAIDPKRHEQVKHGPERYLIFPRDMVDIHSRSCNKIGVSYTAFRNQATDGYGYGCRQKRGFCLYNQPKDFWYEDKKRLEERKVPRYYAMRYGKMGKIQKNRQTKKFNLAYQTSEMMTSMILLQLSADDIVLVYNRAKGIIARASVAKFEALSGSGKMHVEVNNVGVVSAEFFVRVTHCSDGVRSVQEQGGTVIPKHNKVFVFAITVFKRDASIYSCQARLFDAARKLVDSKNVTFQTESACVCMPGCECKCSGRATSHHCVDKAEEGIVINGKDLKGSFFEKFFDMIGSMVKPVLGLFSFLGGGKSALIYIGAVVIILILIAVATRLSCFFKVFKFLMPSKKPKSMFKQNTKDPARKRMMEDIGDDSDDEIVMFPDPNDTVYMKDGRYIKDVPQFTHASNVTRVINTSTPFDASTADEATTACDALTTYDDTTTYDASAADETTTAYDASTTYDTTTTNDASGVDDETTVYDASEAIDASTAVDPSEATDTYRH